MYQTLISFIHFTCMYMYPVYMIVNFYTRYLEGIYFYSIHKETSYSTQLQVHSCNVPSSVHNNM